MTPGYPDHLLPCLALIVPTGQPIFPLINLFRLYKVDHTTHTVTHTTVTLLRDTAVTHIPSFCTRLNTLTHHRAVHMLNSTPKPRWRSKAHAYALLQTSTDHYLHQTTRVQTPPTHYTHSDPMYITQCNSITLLEHTTYTLPSHRRLMRWLWTKRLDTLDSIDCTTCTEHTQSTHTPRL